MVCNLGDTSGTIITMFFGNYSEFRIQESEL